MTSVGAPILRSSEAMGMMPGVEATPAVLGAAGSSTLGKGTIL